MLYVRQPAPGGEQELERMQRQESGEIHDDDPPIHPFS